MAWSPPPTDVLLQLLGAPHQTELVSSALRLTTALLGKGARVQVWACGDATRLTWTGLGETKPRNYGDWDREYPSATRIVRELLTDHPDRLYWYVCAFCAEERGTADQIPQVRRRPMFKYAEHVAVAGKCLSLGVH